MISQAQTPNEFEVGKIYLWCEGNTMMFSITKQGHLISSNISLKIDQFFLVLEQYSHCQSSNIPEFLTKKIKILIFGSETVGWVFPCSAKITPLNINE